MSNHEEISVVLKLLKAGATAPRHDFRLKGRMKLLYNTINIAAFIIGVYIIYKIIA